VSKVSFPVFDVNDIMACGWRLLDVSESEGHPPRSAMVLQITCKCGCPHSITLRPGSLIAMRDPIAGGGDITINNVTWNGYWEPGEGPPGAEEGALRDGGSPQ
jgi:hypothetical protein